MTKNQKISSFGWWNVLRSVLKWGAYVIIIFEGISDIMRKIENKDGIKQIEE